MRPLDWLTSASIARRVSFLRRQIVALGRRATAAARKRPAFWIVPLVLVGLLAAWKGPEWQLADARPEALQPVDSTKEYFELVNSYRATIVQALGGLFLLLTIYFMWRRVTATERQVEIAGEGQITERFTRAIDQLGSEKLEIRLGGIYALERIARDSERDHWPIMEVLTAYVRENAPRSEEREGEEVPSWPATDIQAVLTVLRRRRVEFETDRGQRLDLRVTNLNKANLNGAKLSTAGASGSDLDGPNLFMAALPFADLSQADLRAADLFGANLTMADLRDADLSRAHLNGGCLRAAELSGADLTAANLLGADLTMADLPDADLSAANLSAADLSGANLFGADLSEADLSGANLKGVDMSKAIGLTREQIESAITDEKTNLPDYLKDAKEEPPQEAEGGEGKS